MNECYGDCFCCPYYHYCPFVMDAEDDLYDEDYYDDPYYDP